MNAVTPCVDFGTGDRRRDDFYPERAAGALGTQERDRADPRIEVEKAVFGAEFKERERPLVKSRRLRCVHLQERFGTHFKREAFERRFDRFTPFNDVRGAFLKAEHGIAGVRVHVEGQMFEGKRRESRTNACNGGFRGPLAQDERHEPFASCRAGCRRALAHEERAHRSRAARFVVGREKVLFAGRRRVHERSAYACGFVHPGGRKRAVFRGDHLVGPGAKESEAAPAVWRALSARIEHGFVSKARPRGFGLLKGLGAKRVRVKARSGKFVLQ